MEDSFIKTRDITHDRFVLLSSKHHKGKSVESFNGRPIEQAYYCNLGDEETKLIREIFILNMLDFDTQK